MNKNVLIVLAGGFLIAVLVAMIVSASLNGGDEEPVKEAKAEPKSYIIVASKDIKTGDKLSEENMKWKEWPKSGVFPGAVEREDDEDVLEVLTGRAKRNISEGEPIPQSAVVTADKTNMLTVALEPGMRAFSINVDPAGMVSGFISPGDYVDIMLTYRTRIDYEGFDEEVADLVIERNLENLATETILQNVKVLAIDQSAGRADDEEGGAKVGKTVTLEVDRKAAETLAMASSMGDLSLTLRGLGDNTVVKDNSPVTTDARTTRIFDEVLDEVIKAQQTSGQNRKVVRIYRGNSVENIAVKP